VRFVNRRPTQADMDAGPDRVDYETMSIRRHLSVRVSLIPGQDFGKSRTEISVIPGQRFR
ncbi:hypothetical protein, partial [Bradyrhizobium sp.]|uniref:hypothetical protein n=1 Tax=Bradyrhizobium sp. TaxID=376 RepID=UPI003C5C9D69